MKKLTCLLITLIFLAGCFHHAPKKVKPEAPVAPPPFTKFKSNDKDDAHLFQTIGLGYFKVRDWAQAQLYLSKALKLDPGLYWSWYCLGLLNIDSPAGYAYLKKSTEINPDFALPYYWMGYYHCRLREDRKAVPFFKKYIELAEGRAGEEERLRAAKAVLQELYSGKDGKALAMIRQPSRK